MNDENSSSALKNRALFIVMIAVVLIAAIAVAVGVIMHNRQSADGDAFHDQSATLPEIVQTAAMDDVYYDDSTDDPLEYMYEAENFTATVTVKETYNSSATTVYSLVVCGKSFRIENSSQLIIYDGASLYTRTPAFTVIKETSDHNLFTELGMLSIDRIKAQVADGAAEMALSENGREIYVRFRGNEGQLERECVISVDYGIVTSDKIFNDDGTILLRDCSIYGISLITEKDISDDRFAIPEQNGGENEN